jgi:hypothetical protein
MKRTTANRRLLSILTAILIPIREITGCEGIWYKNTSRILV